MGGHVASGRRTVISWSSRGYSYPRRRRHGWLKWTPLLVLVLAAAYVGAQLARPVPAAAVRLQLAAHTTVKGAPPRLPWPAKGQAVVAVDGVGTLGASGPNTPVPIASVAKVMTAYVLLKDHPLRPGQQGPDITMTARDAEAGATGASESQSELHVQAGEKLSERQVLEALLVASANNVAAAVARWDAGNGPAFLAKMNGQAKALGMTHTRYTDPSGFAGSTVSTARDQLRLARAAMAVPVIREVVAMPQSRFPLAGLVYNWNAMVGHDGFVGIKTGSSAAAAGCLMFAARKPVAGATRLVYGVVLGQTGPAGLIGAALDASRRLVDAVPAAVHSVDVLPAGATVAAVDAPDNPATTVRLTRPLRMLGWAGMRVDLSVALPRTPGNGPLRGTVTAATVGQRASAPAASSRDLRSPSLAWRLQRMPWD